MGGRASIASLLFGWIMFTFDNGLTHGILKCPLCSDNY